MVIVVSSLGLVPLLNHLIRVESRGISVIRVSSCEVIRDYKEDLVID